MWLTIFLPPLSLIPCHLQITYHCRIMQIFTYLPTLSMSINLVVTPCTYRTHINIVVHTSTTLTLGRVMVRWIRNKLHPQAKPCEQSTNNTNLSRLDLVWNHPNNEFLSDEGTSLAKKSETYIVTYLVTSNHFNNDVSLSYLDYYYKSIQSSGYSAI